MHARVVVEAAHLAEVEQHRVGEPVGAQQAVHLGEVDERGLRARVLHERLRALEHVAAPVEPGQGQEQLRHRGGRAEPIDEALERALVLAAQRLAQLVRGGFIGVDVLEDAAKEVGLAHVDLEVLEAERAEPLHRHRDHLGVAFRVGQPDQLHARLVELAVAAHVRLVVAEDVGDVAEAERLGVVPHPRRHDARDLRRDVRAQGEQPPALAVHHLEHPLLQVVIRALGEHVEVLVRRRHELAIAPAPEDAEEALLHRALSRRLVGQVDLGALGELRRLSSSPHRPHSYRVAGALSRWASVFMRCSAVQSGAELELRDAGRRHLERPQAVEPEPEGFEDQDARRDAVRDEADRLRRRASASAPRGPSSTRRRTSSSVSPPARATR